ncbi:MAG: NAD-glutamate dehydrogenase domain-containing protein, partial [Sulfurovum sp.]|jgi:glutamate dehydrogenase
MAASNIEAICSQLLTQDDLAIDNELFTQVLNEDIVTKILETNGEKYIKIFSKEQLYLSHITPLLHNIGFVIKDEVTFNVKSENNLIYISRFNLSLEDDCKIEIAKENIENIVSRCLKNNEVVHSKAFSLVYEQNFDYRRILLIRAFIEYLDQAVLIVNSSAILNTFTSHHHLTALFIKYFIVKFDPCLKGKRETKLESIETKIREEIKKIPQILDDKILNFTLLFLKSLLRTNFFFDNEVISFKIDTNCFGKDLKGLQPNIENFIFHTDFYGVHLRMTKVSRGGLRWSDRHDDYRQEVKSLMITQEGKNSIIIPDGSKGGFVINKDQSLVTKNYFKEVYSMFINGNLDLVDNLVDNKIHTDERIVAYDGEDPYFVVAADKGTAAMSDVANQISVDRGYWLKDAFASGGSNGYGHKDLGITARGSLMSSKRFFIESGIDFYTQEVSVVGIGSMSGDVFGNGMIESSKFKLVGAISHKDIFVDPNPDLDVSYAERKRLFESNNGGWKNYDTSLISKGGGIFSRNDKEITLSAEMKKLLSTTKKVVSGEELCKMLLTLDVDLLFNGGVGTYVKGTDENNLDLGDKQNEAVRVDASELRAKIVCEGGNLGFTQKARIEYSLNGGRINQDAIDNAAGVNTSDHEVNLKILLYMLVEKGILTIQQASETLQSLSEQVVSKVLQNNYDQALVISFDENLSKKQINSFKKTIEVLERNIETFNRKDFYIPKNENIQDITDINGVIVRPVLSSLISYSKILIKKILLESNMIDESFFVQYLFRYFPKSFVGVYENEILHHPLKREIIATMIADILINYQGSTFISDFEKLGTEKFLLKIKSYLIAKQLFGTQEIKEKIRCQDYKMDVEEQYSLINKLEYTLFTTTKWMIKYLKEGQVDANHILEHKDEMFTQLSKIHQDNIKVIIEGDDEFNQFYTVIDYLRFAVPAIVVKEETHHTFKDVLIIFYSLIHEFDILEILLSLNKIEISSKSDLTLRNQVLQFIDFIVIYYTKKILYFQRINEEPELAFTNYVANEKEKFHKVRDYLDSFMTKENKDIKEIAITVNQLMVSLI